MDFRQRLTLYVVVVSSTSEIGRLRERLANRAPRWSSWCRSGAGQLGLRFAVGLVAGHDPPVVANVSQAFWAILSHHE